MNQEKAERIYFWDNAKGILIFLVVFGHFLLPYRSIPLVRIVFDLIYLFHMPAFAFVSGHLSQRTSDKRKAIVKLGITYLLFNLPMMIYGYMFEGTAPSLLTPYYSYWYLIALIAWRLISPTLATSREALPISIAVSILIGFWNEIGNQLALSRIIGFLPFFLAGYKLSEQKLKDFLSTKRTPHIVLGFALLGIVFYLGIYLSLTEIILNDLLFFPYAAPGRFLYRILMFMFSLSIGIAATLMLPQRPIRWFSKWGRNSLAIYMLHRYIPLLMFVVIPFRNESTVVLSASLLASMITLFVLGFDSLNTKFNKLLDTCTEAFSVTNYGNRGVRIAFFAFLLCHLLFVISLNPVKKQEDIMHKVLSSQQKAQIENAVSLAFVGDLILLRDQVREAYSDKMQNYDFDPVFSYAKKYLLTSDYSIGVLEGPLAGQGPGYTNSNYDDGIQLRLNFPDSFADSIKTSGIDLVTLANNHILDMNLEGAMRTLDVLDEKAIQHVGSYRNPEEKSRTKIVEIKGIRLAILAYTYSSNYFSEAYFFETNPSLTSIIVEPNSHFFSAARHQVKIDFERAKAEKPDLIVVLPHMGTQFLNTTDKFQNTWNEIFVQEGADIILGDHAHAVQPIEFRSIKTGDREKQTLIVNCPGNFANSYMEHNGDATSIVKVYIDQESKSVLCVGVIPMMTLARGNKHHQALPVYDILSDLELKSQLSVCDRKRVKEVQGLITEVMLGTRLTLDQAQNIHYLFPDGYYRQPVNAIKINTDFARSEALKMLQNSNSVVFIGDSITQGTKNGGYGWFEPLTESFPNLIVNREAWGGATTFALLEKADRIASHAADLYVIAAGTNDIRYRDKNSCAMTPAQYIENLDKLTKSILHKNSRTKFIFIAPWPSLANDPFTPLSSDVKEKTFADYTKSLEGYCMQKGHIFVDPTSKILSAIDKKVAGYFLLDHIHPNAAEGLKLYSEAFLATQ